MSKPRESLMKYNKVTSLSKSSKLLLKCNSMTKLFSKSSLSLNPSPEQLLDSGFPKSPKTGLLGKVFLYFSPSFLAAASIRSDPGAYCKDKLNKSSSGSFNCILNISLTYSLLHNYISIAIGDCHKVSIPIIVSISIIVLLIQILCPEYEGKLYAKICFVTNGVIALSLKQPLDILRSGDEHKFFIHGHSLDQIRIKIQIRRSKYKRMKSK